MTWQVPSAVIPSPRLSQQTGIGHEDLLAGLSQHLPDLINQLTPHGRLPTEDEAARMV